MADRSRVLRWSDPSIAVHAALTMTGMQRLESILRGDMPKPPMAELVDIAMTLVEPGRVAFEGRPAEYIYNLGGVAHGAYACALLDSALGCAVTSLLPAGQSCTTTDLHVRFVKPITVSSGTVRCEANVLHLGKTIATAEAKLVDASGRLCAHATTACAILQEG